MSLTLNPTALVVDDSPVQRKMMDAVLMSLGISVEAVNTAQEFLDKVPTRKWDLCFVDLHIDSLGIGFTLIEKVRAQAGHQPILFVMSAQSDQQAIAHGLEIGANDFLVKPLTREVLVSKLVRYIKTAQLDDAQQKGARLKGDGIPVKMGVEMELLEIDEFGLKVSGKNLVAKGVSVELDGPPVQILTGKKDALIMTVTSTWLESNDPPVYGIALEFSSEDKELKDTVRRYLAGS